MIRVSNRFYTPGEAMRLRTAVGHIERLGGNSTRKDSGVRSIHDEGMPLAARLTVGRETPQEYAVYGLPQNVSSGTLLSELREFRGGGRFDLLRHIADAESALVTSSPTAEALMVAGSAAIRDGVQSIPAAEDGQLTLRFAPKGKDLMPSLEGLVPSRWEHCAAGLCSSLGLPLAQGRELIPGILEQLEITLGETPTVCRSPMALLAEAPHPDYPRLYVRRDWASLHVRLMAPSTNPDLEHSRVEVMAAGLLYLAQTTDVALTF